MSKKISVIVPIYNVEQYLDKCIESLINQTYKNLEIILVDDGSKDKSGKIADLWALKDSRIKVVHKKNGGLSDARNEGMKNATGRYIGFVDSDDYIDMNMYENMLDILQQNDIDIVECGINYVYDDKIVKEVVSNNIKVFSTHDALKELILERELHQTVWNKLYKRECVIGEFFEMGRINEDEFWTYRIFSKAKKVAKINKNLYFYLQRNNSIMSEKNYSLKRLDGLEARFQRLKYIENNYNDLFFIDKKSFYFCCIYHYQYILRSNNKKQLEDGFNTISNYIKNIKFSKEDIRLLKTKEKLWILLSRVSLKNTCILRNKLKIGV